MIPGIRGIFGAIGEKISTKYDIPPIFVEWIGIFVFWVLFVIFNPDRFSSFDVYLLLGIYVLSLFIYLVTGNIKEVFKKPSVADRDFAQSIQQIQKNYLKSQKKKKKKKKIDFILGAAAGRQNLKFICYYNVILNVF